ncbi:SIS domain-containing protein [uncultured Draconibacterium sp.]|uniref:D-sedoheptulose-7-phosphate isomerase n=1 Tax=uncultured Draconibacterium sp. TaxID=1573823 RepID=UPI0025EB3682|nr:SIS domain-containing protein [uncultured Draconibacterium sp.]
MCKTAEQIKELSVLCERVLADKQITATLDQVTTTIINAYKTGNKTIFCGNGGSAAEAQHLAAELSGKFNFERRPIPAEACHVNSSFVTAVSNDYDFTQVYSRHIDGFGCKGDILIGLSTSGTSENIVNAFKTAQTKGLTTVALTGKTGGALDALSDFIIKVPSENVPRIQEIHLLLGHIICEKVEKALFGDEH